MNGKWTDGGEMETNAIFKGDKTPLLWYSYSIITLNREIHWLLMLIQIINISLEFEDSVPHIPINVNDTPFSNSLQIYLIQVDQFNR